MKGQAVQKQEMAGVAAVRGALTGKAGREQTTVFFFFQEKLLLRFGFLLVTKNSKLKQHESSAQRDSQHLALAHDRWDQANRRRCQRG